MLFRNRRATHQQKPSTAPADVQVLGGLQDDLAGWIAPSILSEFHFFQAVETTGRSGEYPQRLLDAVAIGRRTVTVHRRRQLAPWRAVVISPHDAIVRANQAETAVHELAAHLPQDPLVRALGVRNSIDRNLCLEHAIRGSNGPHT